MNAGKLHVYYSEAFPRFATEMRRFDQQGEALAKSFRSRYETWLAVHALLMHQDIEAHSVEGADEAAQREMHRQERCRHATIAAMVASQEVKSGAEGEAEDEAA
jgi:hypothetical protein